MELSKRLTKVASLVTEGASVADIGTDHGYIPIYLIENNIAARAIALDINKGPLERARMHIVGHGLKGQIETRLSDGLKEVEPGEVDTMIAAGMGGGLVIKILREGKPVVDTLKSCILQPQSEIHRVRRYVAENQMKIVAEEVPGPGDGHPGKHLWPAEQAKRQRKRCQAYGRGTRGDRDASGGAGVF